MGRKCTEMAPNTSATMATEYPDFRVSDDVNVGTVAQRVVADSELHPGITSCAPGAAIIGGTGGTRPPTFWLGTQR